MSWLGDREGENVEKDKLENRFKEQDSEAPKNMPMPLFSAFMGMIGIGLADMLLCCIAMIAYAHKFNAACLALQIVGIYLIVRGLLIRKKWAAGEIEEKLLRCVSVSRRYKSYQILCTEVDDSSMQHISEFTVPRNKKTKRSLFAGALLLVYVDRKSPRAPVAWQVFGEKGD